MRNISYVAIVTVTSVYVMLIGRQEALSDAPKPLRNEETLAESSGSSADVHYASYDFTDPLGGSAISAISMVAEEVFKFLGI